MTERTIFRMHDVVDAISQIDLLLKDTGLDDLLADRVRRAAYERFLEILSEASRHIPDVMKAEEPGIPWARIAGIGNHLRHAYHRVDAEILWRVWADGDLASLHEATVRMIGKLK
ncbi:MAG: HepT-like ribonuclease domain-containing protein [Rhizobiaceae bacterium]